MLKILGIIYLIFGLIGSSLLYYDPDMKESRINFEPRFSLNEKTKSQ